MSANKTEMAEIRKIQEDRDALLRACRIMWAGVRDVNRAEIDSEHSSTELVAVLALWDGLKILRDAIVKAESNRKPWMEARDSEATR